MKNKRIIGAICLVCMLFSLSLPVSANSAQRYWWGADATGAILTDGESPVVVERERLTFDLAEFPRNYYTDEEDFSQYTARVTAEYSFYNPSDLTVTATLAFPFGKEPAYAYNFADDAEAEKYGVKTNGEDAPSTVRHTLSYRYSPFELEYDLPRLHNDYISEGMFTPEATVTLYTFTVSGIDEDAYPASTIALDLTKDDSRVYYMVGQSGMRLYDNSVVRISDFIRNKTEAPAVYLYVFGKPLDKIPQWKFYRDGGAKKGEEISGQAELYETKTMTLMDFALENYDVESGVSRLDWYNAVVCDLTEGMHSADIPMTDPQGYENNYSGYFMRWYEYEITLAPGERLTNTVTAPMYPSIDAGYTPSIYTYTYLLSPASTWAGFGQLDIIINTPYYLTDSNITGFEKSEDGYSLTLDGLPRGKDGEYLDLEFTLCTEEKTISRSKQSTNNFFSGLWQVISYPFRVIISAVKSLFNWIGSLFS